MKVRIGEQCARTLSLAWKANSVVASPANHEGMGQEAGRGTQWGLAECKIPQEFIEGG